MPIFDGYISYAPFPEGFHGDMDETFQQSGQLATIYISGNFLTGFYYPIGTVPAPTLPTSDQGPICANGQWYFWDPVTGQYLPQTQSIRPARNFAKNAIYQIQQTGSSFTLGAAAANTYDMSVARTTVGSVLAISTDVGPLATADTDFCSKAIKYTVGPSIVATPAATDLFVHEHLIEGIDISSIRGQTLSLSFSIWVNQPGAYSAYLTSTGRDMSYVYPFTISTASQWGRIKINNIPALPTGNGTWSFSEGDTGLYLGVVMAVGGQYKTANPNQWVSGFFAGTNANSNMVSVVNNQMKISGVKLEASPTSTYCVANSFEQDYHDCTRYYWTTFNYQVLNAGVGIAATAQVANNALFNFVFPRRMCKIPIVTPYGSSSFASGKVTNLSTATDYTCATLGATAKGVSSNPAGLTAAKGDVFTAFITADARLV